MANLTNSVRSDNLTTAVGGTIANTVDSINLSQWPDVYQAGISLSGKTLDVFTMGPNYSGDIDPLPLVISATAAYIRWGGRILRLGGGTWGTTVLDAARGGVIEAANMTFTTFWGVNGTLNGADSCVVTTAHVSRAGRLYLAKGGTAPTTINVREGGFVELRRASGTNNVYGGELLINDPSATQTALNQHGGKVTIINGGTITAYAGYAGVMDLRQLSSDITFTSATLGPVKILMPGSSGPTVTFTSRTDVGPGPQFVQ